MNRCIARLAKYNPLVTSTSILKGKNVNISAFTIRRRLVANDLHGRATGKVPLLSKKKVLQPDRCLRNLMRNGKLKNIHYGVTK